MAPLTATTSRRWGGEYRRIPLDSNASCMCKHPSLDIVAVSGKGFIVFLDLEGKQLGKVERGVEDVKSVTFDSTGRWLFASVEPEKRDGETGGHTKKWEVAAVLEGRESEGDELVEISRLLTNNAAAYLHDLARWPDLEITHILPTFQSDVDKSLDAATLSRSLLLGHFQEGQFGSFGSQKFSNDGDSIILFVARNKIRIVPLRSDRNSDVNRPILTFSHPTAEDGSWQNDEAIMWIGQSPDSQLYATVSWDKTAILWSARTGEKLHTLTGPTGQNWVGVFAPHSEWFAVGGGDKTVYVFSTGTGELLQSLGGFQDWVRMIAVSNDGSRLIAGALGSVHEFDTTTWNLARLIEVKDAPDGRIGRPAGRFWRRPAIAHLRYALFKSGAAIVLKMVDERIFVFESGVMADNGGVGPGDGLGANCQLRIDPVGGTGIKSLLIWGQETRTGKELWSADGDKCIRCWNFE